MQTTPHPQLKRWTDADFPAWIAIHQDDKVAEWLGGPISAELLRAAFDRASDHLAQHDWGVWAVLDSRGEVVGAAGLQPIRAGFPVTGVEATWRLRSDAWGQGLVTAVMPDLLADAFTRFSPEEIIAFTPRRNLKSQSVMQRLGFQRDESRDFDHPALANDHPLLRHVVYCLNRPQEGQTHD